RRVIKIDVLAIVNAAELNDVALVGDDVNQLILVEAFLDWIVLFIAFLARFSADGQVLGLAVNAVELEAEHAVGYRRGAIERYDDVVDSANAIEINRLV